MKKLLPILLTVLCTLAACRQNAGDPQHAEEIAYTPPAAGTVVAKAATETDDELNHFTFSVLVTTGSMSDKGVYNVVAVYGHDTAQGQFTMPKGGERLKPLLRQSEPSVFMVGFRYGNDTSFNDYYEISGRRGMIGMQYVKAYSFE